MKPPTDWNLKIEQVPFKWNKMRDNDRYARHKKSSTQIEEQKYEQQQQQLNKNEKRRKKN